MKILILIEGFKGLTKPRVSRTWVGWAVVLIYLKRAEILVPQNGHLGYWINMPPSKKESSKYPLCFKWGHHLNMVVQLFSLLFTQDPVNILLEKIVSGCM